jgi:hypothetical protein
MADEYMEEEEKRGFFSRLFGRKKEEEETEEAPHYNRRLFDGRIEKYLDHNLDSYIAEYGIVTELDLQGYENRYDKLTGRVKSIKEFILDSDAILGQMEKDLLDVKGKIKPAKK